MVSPTAILTNALNNYIVRPSNAFGLGGFVFDIEGETTINLRTEITDHYLEDNTTVQDHIAVKPKKVTLKSYVGELVYRPEGNETTFVEKAVRKLTVLNSFLPELTSASQAIKDLRSKDVRSVIDNVGSNITSQTINKAVDYYSLARNILNTDNKQQQAYMYFKALMEQKIIVSLQTPFEYVSNMAIESITAYQGEDSKFISDFTITLKEIRTVELLGADIGASQYTTKEGLGDRYQERAGTQNGIVENLGNVSGADVDYSVADLPNSGLISIVDPYQFEGLTAEDLEGLRRYEQGGGNPVVNLFDAGVVTNVRDE